MIFEIINPSDAYTIKSDDYGAVAVVNMFVGTGHYGLQQLDGEWQMPVLFMGGGDEWCESKFNKDIEGLVDDYMQNHIDKLIKVADSCVIGKPEDRDIYETTIKMLKGKKAQDFKKTWIDKKRSSLNDIGAGYEELSKKLKKFKKEKNNEVK